MKADITIQEVASVADLPIPENPLPRNKLGIFCPNWNKFEPYRATAWAYLTREDGGPFVVYGGKIYRRNAITTKTLV